ncbi:MAG TPA: serine/threonine-protein kinase [Polyangiaceae bacterium]|jgi:serine/threonine-protein kinase
MTAAANVDGTEIIGRYALHGEIASGGMAVVHFGRLLGPVGFTRPVAIKRLHPQLAREPNVRAMFIDEARLASRIRHPNVVPTLDVVTDGGDLLLVMEYVHGESLQQLLRAVRKRGERVPLRITLAVMTAVLHGLHAAHEATTETGQPLNVVHRDVSPQNIMVGVDGVARVLDFGIARATVRLENTREGIVKGKLAYMAPEQLGGVVVDRRADVYAATVVLWEMLTGKRLFVREDGGTVLIEKLLRGTIEAPGVYAPGTPRLLDAIALHGLARTADQRFATAREMALALERLGELAPASEVGVWVESLAAPTLTERAVRLKQLEMTSSTYRVQAAPAAADRVLPGLFEDEEDVQQEPLLDHLFPLEEIDVELESPTPPTVGPPRYASAMMPMATPQAIEVPIAVARRAPPRALVVFAAYALLGAAIVLLAGALRWTRGERSTAAAAAVVPCPPGMSRVPATDGGAPSPYCQVNASPATSSMRVISAPGPTRIGGPQ